MLRQRIVVDTLHARVVLFFLGGCHLRIVDVNVMDFRPVRPARCLGFELWLVRSQPGLSLRELAEQEGISAPSMSGHVDRLEAAGLLLRVRSTDDRRRVGLELTPEGRSLLKRVRARRTTWLADRLEQLSDEERERIEAALPTLHALLGHES